MAGSPEADKQSMIDFVPMDLKLGDITLVPRRRKKEAEGHKSYLPGKSQIMQQKGITDLFNSQGVRNADIDQKYHDLVSNYDTKS